MPRLVDDERVCDVEHRRLPRTKDELVDRTDRYLSRKKKRVKKARPPEAATLAELEAEFGLFHPGPPAPTLASLAEQTSLEADQGQHPPNAARALHLAWLRTLRDHRAWDELEGCCLKIEQAFRGVDAPWILRWLRKERESEADIAEARGRAKVALDRIIKKLPEGRGGARSRSGAKRNKKLRANAVSNHEEWLGYKKRHGPKTTIDEWLNNLGLSGPENKAERKRLRRSQEYGGKLKREEEKADREKARQMK
ncbi:MAG: hypothetical protein DWP92_08380 [Armatimonadetes bacterium]|nr:MAG: hypothetical protein DWP92_08380 [Armatimonadota bacterium]